MGILDVIGNTPLVEVGHINREGTVVVILPDRGDRYLSTALFTSVCGKCPP